MFRSYNGSFARFVGHNGLLYRNTEFASAFKYNFTNFGNFLNRFQLKFLVAVNATRSIFPTVLLVITIVTSVDSSLLNKEKKTGKFQESREKEWLVKKFLLLHGRRETGTEPRLGHPFNLRPIPNTVASPT